MPAPNKKPPQAARNRSRIGPVVIQPGAREPFQGGEGLPVSQKRELECETLNFSPLFEVFFFALL